MTTLQVYGWNKARKLDWDDRNFQNWAPARIIADYGRFYKVATPNEMDARLAGSLVHKLASTEMPKIGDWVAIEPNSDQSATIQFILPRTSEMSRRSIGSSTNTTRQVIAANVDIAFIVQPLDHDFSPNRLERYVFQLKSQNIEPIILLNKSDKVTDTTAKQSELNRLNVTTIIMSALYDDNFSQIMNFIKPGKTVVILGSSGAGKSTLVNKLIGRDIQKTQNIREIDSKGRHTTVHRELFLLPNGGMVIDSPGIRELQLWGNVEDLNIAFPEITSAISQCHFKNCTHNTEVGCAIISGIENGSIDQKRYSAYQNFKNELESLAQANIETNRRTQQSRSNFLRRKKRLFDDKSSWED